MPQLLLRDVEFDLIRLLRKRAAKNNRSQDAEHIAILRQALQGEQRGMGGKVEHMMAALRASDMAKPPETGDAG